MSLYLPEQKLGSHSTEGSSSNKFVLKGRQTGPMHRGHTWVFRAESYDTMMAWYDDIKTLTERTPEERNNLVRASSRSISRSSQRSSMSSDYIDDDEEPPFAATVPSVGQQPKQDAILRRPSGGRFPSDLQVNAQRGLQVPPSPLSVSFGHEGNTSHDSSAAPQGADPGRQLQSNEGAGRDSYPTQAVANSSGVDPVQPTSSSVSLGSRHLAEGQLAGVAAAPSSAEASLNGGSGDGPVRTEPVPVTVPSHQVQNSSLRNGVGNEGFNTQGAAVVNGQGSSSKAEPRTAGDKAGARPETVNGGASAEKKDIPTASQLHIPGQYPKGSVAGF